MEQKVKAMFAWALEGEKTARLFGERYKKAGIEVTFHGEAVQDELILLGQKGDMTHVLYFLDHEKLLLVSLADEMGGFTVEVLVEELILPC
ncbi:hypothetical protein [Anaerotignum sp. MB30-C6]|uniref:hypothetical protein n=1 Tax=Anaerotignum sp. MB30-C6 TaxID=3070814 RepID=UPI0027DC9AC4|nr:hypothetical protein [Anaerotignum sp. MB30-C6]WMI80807.1 hypothetical protein RBQ60_13450 [Anaerotignum sp. MB30-C6]